MSDTIITLGDRDEAVKLYGNRDQYLREIRDALGVRLVARGDTIQVRGTDEQIDQAQRVFGQLRSMLRQQDRLSLEDVRTVLEVVHSGGDRIAIQPEAVVEGSRFARPRTDGQARYVHAMQHHDLTMCVGPAGTGKCVAGDTLVLTGKGLIPIQELGANTAPGTYSEQHNQVFGVCGPDDASHIYNGGQNQTIRIHTRHGLELEGTPEHPVLVLNEFGEPKWTPLAQVRQGTFVAVARGTNLFGQEVAVNFHYQRNPKDYYSRNVTMDHLDPEFAYFMGLMVGDGCLRASNRVIFTSADQQLRETFETVIGRWNLHWFANSDRPYDMVVASRQLQQLLFHVGLNGKLAHEKEIPSTILRAPRELVISFMQGLFDTDGSVDHRDGYPSFATSSPRLARQVQLLLINLGVVARLRSKPTACRTAYILEVRGEEASRFMELVGFRLKRKAARVRLRTHNPNLDLVPHVASLIDSVVRQHTFNRAIHKQLYDYRIGRRTPGYGTLSRMLQLFHKPHPHLNRLNWLIDTHFLWSEVIQIETGHAQVYDLTVPGSHSFVAGGIVNHNTYLAVSMAVSMLRQAQVKKIVLVRPAVEAGEKLGYLPGDIAAKVNPYLRPLFDALNDMMEPEQVKRYMENDIIEIVPLAFMRGRAQPLTSQVLTPSGFVPLGSLRVGDQVIGSNGDPVRVEGVFPQGKKDVFQVSFTDRSSTRCCAEHLWAVHTPADKRRGKPARVLQTQEMIGKLRAAHQHRYEVPVLSSPVDFPAQPVSMDPYVLGLLLGDGCVTGSTTPSFATEDRELVEVLEQNLAETTLRHRGGCDYVFNHISRRRGPLPNPVSTLVREVGLWGTHSYDKFVPPEYLINSAEVRLAVLQGLLDTDGGAVTQDGRTCRLQYVSTSSQLRDDMLFLVRSLGGVASWTRRKAEGRKPGRAKGRPIPYRHDAYVVEIRLPSTMQPFRLQRKADTYQAWGGGRPQRYITRIEPDGAEETVCISVASEDSLYVTDDFILTHNTLNQAVIILDEGQNCTIAQMKMFLTRMGNGSKVIVTGDITQVDLPKQTRSGLIDAVQRLRNIERIALVHLDEHDIVRNPLVQEILRAYEIDKARKKKE